jgi:hypothetical protein
MIHEVCEVMKASMDGIRFQQRGNVPPVCSYWPRRSGFPVTQLHAGLYASLLRMPFEQRSHRLPMLSPRATRCVSRACAEHGISEPHAYRLVNQHSEGNVTDRHHGKTKTRSGAKHSTSNPVLLGERLLRELQLEVARRVPER